MWACLVTQLWLTLWDRMDCSPPASSVHGILQAGILEWVAISSSRGSSRPRVWTRGLLHLLHWQVDSLPLSYLGSPQFSICFYLNFGDKYSSTERERNSDWKIKMETSLLHLAPVHFLSWSLGWTCASEDQDFFEYRRSNITRHERVLYLWGHWAVLCGIALGPFILCGSLLIYKVSTKTQSPYLLLGFWHLRPEMS